MLKLICFLHHSGDYNPQGLRHFRPHNLIKLVCRLQHCSLEISENFLCQVMEQLTILNRHDRRRRSRTQKKMSKTVSMPSQSLASLLIRFLNVVKYYLEIVMHLTFRTPKDTVTTTISAAKVFSPFVTLFFAKIRSGLPSLHSISGRMETTS